MVIRYSFFITLLLFSGLLAAQSNWHFGKITTNEGIEKKGQIDDRNWTYHFKNFRIKNTKSGKIERVDLKDITSFTVNGRRYFVGDIPVNTSPRGVGDLLRPHQQETETIRGALLLLVEGPLALYEYADKRTNSHFFIGHPDGTLEYLNHNRYFMDDQYERSGYQENNGFRGQLVQAMQDCERMSFELRTLEYRRDKMLEVFENYYNCGRKRSGYWHEPGGNAWFFGLDIGAHITSPKYGQLPPGGYRFSDLSSTDPTFGLHAKYRFGGRYGSVSVKLTALYHQFNISETTPDPDVRGESTTASFGYAARERSVHLQLGPQVILVPSRYPIFLESTVEYHHIIDYSEFHSRTVTNASGTITAGTPLSTRNQPALGLSFGAGIVVGDLSFSLRGTAVRRKYSDTVLNLYRVGIIGAYDF
jgi:hypothetical protein